MSEQLSAHAPCCPPKLEPTVEGLVVFNRYQCQCGCKDDDVGHEPLYMRWFKNKWVVNYHLPNPSLNFDLPRLSDVLAELAR